jgi:hypothetical protein
MKSIKNQYIALKEGKMTEAQFMRNVRMTLPEYISNVTLFKQAEKILMNKGIISEIKLDEIGMFNDPIGYKKSEPNPKDEIFKKELQDDGTYTIYKNGEVVKTDIEGEGNANAWINTEKKKLSETKSSNKQKVKDILKEAKDPSATGYYNQDGKEQYSKFDELDNMNAQEIMAGYVMEKQDNPNIDIKEAIKVVVKNLKKDQFYYTNYKLTGIRDVKPTEFTSTKRKPFFDQMEELDKKGTNLVDEKNKMVVVKEAKVEDVKSLLSDETLRNSDIGYGAGDSTGDEVSITYKNYKKLPFEDFSKLEDKYQVYEDILSSGDEPTTVQYFITDKFKSSTSSNPETSKPESDDDVFENYDNKKSKLKELVRKMMKEMFDGRDNLTDIE